jgi:DNA-binding CsgD family transcriptional regulator
VVDLDVARRPPGSPWVPMQHDAHGPEAAGRASSLPEDRSCPGLPHAVEASLRLVATLLDEQVERPGSDSVALDVELGGYRWTVSRVQRRTVEQLSGSLSPRELEIARMVAAGMTNRAIASVLSISPWTVGTHLRRMFSKLDVNSRAAMVALVVERGDCTAATRPGAAAERP